MLQHAFASVKDLVYGIPEMPEPEVGMRWHINQHRSYEHYARGYIDEIASIQVSDKEVEIIRNSWLVTMS